MTSEPLSDAAAARDRQAAEWCIALADDDLRQDDWPLFDAWIADEDNARALDEAIRVWNAADLAADLPELIEFRRAALGDYRQAVGRRWAPAKPRFWLSVGAVAALCLLILSATLWFARDSATIYRTEIGERRIAMLGDGSRLSLDADTTVEVRYRDGRRDLSLLRGRAKFDVAKDPFRPFVVSAADKSIIATGTSFSVELLPGQVHVLLYEGHVAVMANSGGRRVPQLARAMRAVVPAEQLLVPGRELVAPIASASPATLITSPSPPAPTWEAGQLSFDDEPLGVAIERMNRYSKRKLVLGNQAAAGVKVSGVYSAGDVDAFVEGLVALSGVRARESGDRVVIEGR